MKLFYVYEHWRPDRGECFYVGKGRGRRAYKREGRNLHWKGIVSKLSRLGLVYEVKIIAYGLSEEQAFQIEKDTICFWRNKKIDLCNMTEGGEGCSGVSPSDETRQKISIANKGRTRTKSTRNKISLGKLGKPFSEDHRKHLSEAFQGKKYSEETRLKMSSSMKKRANTKPFRESVSLHHKGKVLSEETKAKISTSLKLRLAMKRGKVLSLEEGSA